MNKPFNDKTTMRAELLVKELPKHNWNFGVAMRAVGYSDAYAHNPHRLKSTKGYNRLMKSVLDKARLERERIIDDISARKLEGEKYTDLVNSMEKLDKIIRLAEGKPTEITSESKMRQLSNEELRQILSTEEGTEDEVIRPSSEGTGEEGVSE